MTIHYYPVIELKSKVNGPFELGEISGIEKSMNFQAESRDRNETHELVDKFFDVFEKLRTEME